MLGEVSFSGLSPHGEPPDTISHRLTRKIHVYTVSADILKIIVYERKVSNTILLLFRVFTDNTAENIASNNNKYPEKEKNPLCTKISNCDRQHLKNNGK